MAQVSAGVDNLMQMFMRCSGEVGTPGQWMLTLRCTPLSRPLSLWTTPRLAHTGCTTGEDTTELAMTFKRAGEASQVDACPVAHIRDGEVSVT
jgi:hypothetical protein